MIRVNIGVKQFCNQVIKSSLFGILWGYWKVLSLGDSMGTCSCSLALGDFFICYLAGPQSTLGHCQGYSQTNPMLIIACFSRFDLKVTGVEGSLKQDWLSNPSRVASGVWTGNIPILKVIP